MKQLLLHINGTVLKSSDGEFKQTLQSILQFHKLIHVHYNTFTHLTWLYQRCSEPNNNDLWSNFCGQCAETTANY
jgi:hypothetical protein